MAAKHDACATRGEAHSSQGSRLEEAFPIDLTGCWELNDKVLVNFMSKFPGLERVILGNIYSITDDCMAGMARYCPNLRVLDITGCWRVTDVGKIMSLLT